MKRLTEFLREFQSFIVIMTIIICGFLLSYKSNEWQNVPWNFFFSCVCAVLMSIFYKEIIPKEMIVYDVSPKIDPTVPIKLKSEE